MTAWTKKAQPKASKTPVKELLHETLRGWEKARPHKTVHASSVTKQDEADLFCPRSYALMDITNKKGKDQFIGTSLRTTFDLGNAIGDMFAERWLLDDVVGNWICVVCDTHHSFCKRPEKCQTCEDHGIVIDPKYLERTWVFEECRFLSKISGISCGIDLFVDLGTPKLRQVELKIIDKDQFAELVFPKAEHELRTNFYLRLMDESGDPNVSQINLDVASIVYVSRGFGTGDKPFFEAHPDLKDAKITPFKEFIVKRDDSLTDGMTLQAESLMKHRAGTTKTLPVRICMDTLCKRAKNCSVVSDCWGAKYG